MGDEGDLTLCGSVNSPSRTAGDTGGGLEGERNHWNYAEDSSRIDGAVRIEFLDS